VWIVASLSEGFPAPVLEAMACGCVVVATDCGGPRDIIEDGLNGFLVPVGDVDAIVSRVQLLLDDVAMRNQMRLRAQETVRHLTWDKCVAELEHSLKSMVDAHDKRSRNMVNDCDTLDMSNV
jgi:glycosyltransferase involved in cell wall biosynthesis